MTPDKLAQYLRIVIVYAVAVAAAAGAGYILLTAKDITTALSNPLVVFASAYLSSILGFHIGVTDPSPAPVAAADTTPPAVVFTQPTPDTAASAQAIVDQTAAAAALPPTE